jgi:CopG family transcriptional regulator, nickel-responsive regulator
MPARPLTQGAVPDLRRAERLRYYPLRMERFTISLSEDLARAFDDLIHEKGYQNRSEAIRDMLRDLLSAEQIERHEAPYCVAALSYVYDHHVRDLAERLAHLQHQHHQLVLSTMHVHLDHRNCLETLMLRGATAEVTAFANTLVAEPQVRHGRLNLVPVDLQEAEHTHHMHYRHVHSSPKT